MLTIILCNYIPQALLTSLDCIVRDRRSKKASINSNKGISKAIATRSKASRVGVFLPLNQRDQFATSIPVSVRKSLYESSKKYSLFFWLKAYIKAIILSIVSKFAINNSAVGYEANIAQTTKHPYQQVLVVNRSPRKGGVIFQNIYEHYKRMWGRSQCPPSFTMPFVADMGDTVMERDCLTTILVGREGYIYLIHAEGTNRYKIGRSVNPITRAADIQKQAPYKLKIVRSAWTLDAPFDEAELHRWYTSWRVFGEWFDLGELLEPTEGYKRHHWETRLYEVQLAFDYYLPTRTRVANYSIDKLGKFLDCDLKSCSPLEDTACRINSLYEELSSRKEVQLAQEFVTCLLPQLILDSYRLPNRDALVSEFSEPIPFS